MKECYTSTLKRCSAGRISATWQSFRWDEQIDNSSGIPGILACWNLAKISFFLCLFLKETEKRGWKRRTILVWISARNLEEPETLSHDTKTNSWVFILKGHAAISTSNATCLHVGLSLRQVLLPGKQGFHHNALDNPT